MSDSRIKLTPRRRIPLSVTSTRVTLVFLTTPAVTVPVPTDRLRHSIISHATPPKCLCYQDFEHQSAQTLGELALADPASLQPDGSDRHCEWIGSTRQNAVNPPTRAMMPSSHSGELSASSQHCQDRLPVRQNNIHVKPIT